MKIYWYWPFVREEELGLVPGAIRPGDQLLVQSLDRPEGVRPLTGAGWSVRPDLPDVPVVPELTPTWFMSRISTYVARAAQRRESERHFSPDLSHVMFLNYFTDPARRRRPRRGGPVRVSTVHDAVPHRGRLPESVQDSVLRRLYDVSGHLVVHHEHVGERLVRQFGVAPERVSVVHPQVPDFGSLGRQPLPDEPRLLFFGTFRSNKGLEVLLEAIQLLRDRCEYRFTIAGRGEEALSRVVEAAAAADGRIDAELGFASARRKSQMYASSRAVVLPYTAFASQSGVLHDAYGHGRPVLVSDVGALGDTVRRDGTGAVVPPSDSGALASAIDAMMVDTKRTEELALAAAAAASDRAPHLVGSRLRDLYEALVEGGVG